MKHLRLKIWLERDSRATWIGPLDMPQWAVPLDYNFYFLTIRRIWGLHTGPWLARSELHRSRQMPRIHLTRTNLLEPSYLLLWQCHP